MSPRDNPRRRLFLRLRRRTRKHTNHRVEYLGNGRERLTCKVCGFVEVHALAPFELHPRAADKLGKYRETGTGVIGACKGCAKIYNDEHYPLDDEHGTA